MADEGAGHGVAHTDGLSLRGAGTVRFGTRQRQRLALLCGCCGVQRDCDSTGRSTWCFQLHRVTVHVPVREMAGLQKIDRTYNRSSVGAAQVLLAGPGRLPEAGPFCAQQNALIQLGCQDTRAAAGCFFGDQWEESAQLVLHRVERGARLLKVAVRQRPVRANSFV